MRMDKVQFKKLRETERFPEPKMNLDIKPPLIRLFEKRLTMYKTSIKVRSFIYLKFWHL